MAEKTSLQLAYSMGYEDKMAGRMYDSSKVESLGRGKCEMKHIKKGPMYDVWKCSACGYEYAENVSETCIVQNYCPNCGREVEL